jgi:hypothetical protein
MRGNRGNEGLASPHELVRKFYNVEEEIYALK